MRSLASSLSSLVALGLLADSARAGQTTLHHNAPNLGSVLELKLDGAAPFARVVLFASPRPADRATFAGRLELERAQLSVLATGFTDALGRWTFQAPIPSDPALAETPLHVQALVDPLGAAPVELSSALHLRWLGSRAYVNTSGASYTPNAVISGGLSIVSLAREQLVATVEYGGLAGGTGTPVFTPNFSRGAVMTGSELVFFDPFFGRVLSRRGFPLAASDVFASSDGTRLYVLEGSPWGTPAAARVHEIDFASAQSLAVTPFAAPIPSMHWVVDPVRRIGYAAAAASSPPFGSVIVQRIDLASMQTLGSVVVGSPNDFAPVDLEFVRGTVVVATLGVNPYFGSLTRIVESAAGPIVEVSPSFVHQARIVPITAVAGFAMATHAVGSPGGWVDFQRLGSSTGAQAPWPPFIEAPRNLASSSRGLWVAVESGGLQSGGYFLLHYDVLDRTWTTVDVDWYHEFPAGMATIVDGSGERLCVALTEVAGPNYLEVRPVLYVLEPESGRTIEIPIGPGANSLLTVAVP